MATLKQIEEKLKKFRKPAKAELTDEEKQTLQEMFAIEGAFDALSKFLLVVEEDKGTSMAYDIEAIDTASSPEEVAEQVKFRKILTSWVRMKLEGLRLQFIQELEEEKEKLEEELKMKKEERQEKEEMEDRGVGEHV